MELFESLVHTVQYSAVQDIVQVRVLMFPSTVPTPYIPFTIRQRGAAAGVMVTASHNPKVEIHNWFCCFSFSGKCI